MTFNISVVSHSIEVVMSTTNSHKSFTLEDTGYNWQSNTNYFVSFTVCTSAGCPRDCGNTIIRTLGVVVVIVCVLFVRVYMYWSSPNYKDSSQNTDSELRLRNSILADVLYSNLVLTNLSPIPLPW